MSNLPINEIRRDFGKRSNDEVASAPLSIGQAISLASLLEASVPKPGNVHRGADFSNTTFYDFMVSAVAIGNVFESAQSLSVGQLVYESIAATKEYVGTNTNLGMVLLFAPLAKTVFTRDSSAESFEIEEVLSQMDPTDCQKVFAAIALADAGGLGEVEAMDVKSVSPDENASPDVSADLLAAMELARDRDSIALQYCNGFAEVRHLVAPTLLQVLKSGESLADAIVFTHVKTMAEIPDTLIARKCGRDVSVQSSRIAKQILAWFETDRQQYNAGLADLDFWLRSDGNRRNPGTTADLIAAGLFLLIRKDMLSSAVIQQGLQAARATRSVDTL